MLRLLWLTDHYHPSPGGMARSCDRIVHSLRNYGVDIDLVHFVPATNAAQSWNWQSKQHGADFRCSILEDRPHTLNLLWNELERRGDYTHVVAFGADIPLLAAPAYSSWLGIPLVTLLRGNDFDTGLFSRKKRDVLLDCLESSQAIGAVSNDKVEKIRALYPKKKVYHTPNGIDLSEWYLLPSQKARKHDSRLVIGLIGQLKAKKGVCFFLDAIKASGFAGQIHLLVTGSLEESAEEHLEALAPALTCEITPFVPRSRLPSHYAACDYVAIPSFYDGMPNVLLEAGGLGIPVIAAKTGGMLDVVEDETHGFLFKNNSQADCIIALEKVLSVHDDERMAQGEALKKHIAECYTSDAERDVLLSIFQNTKL